MKLIKIPDYTGVKYKHVATSWYILKNSDTSDLKDVYYKRIYDKHNKTALRITRPLPKFDVAFVYAVMHISNGTEIKLPIKAVTYNDFTVKQDYDRDVPIDAPVINSIDNRLNIEGYLNIILDRISPSVHDLAAVIVAIEDPKGTIVYFNNAHTENVKILRGQIKSYNPGNEYKVYIWVRNQDSMLSPPRVVRITDNVSDLKFLSPVKGVDGSRTYKVRFNKDVTVETVKLYLGPKLIKTYNGDVIFGDDVLMDNKSYTLSITVKYNGKRFIYTVTILSLYSGGLYDKDTTYSFKDSIIAESMAVVPEVTYTEKTLYGRIVMFREDRVISIKSYSLIVKDIGISGIYCDPGTPVYVRELTELEISVVHRDHGVDKLSILLMNRKGLIEKVLYSVKLPQGSAHLPAAIRNVETKKQYQIFTAIQVDGMAVVVDLVTNTRYGELSGVNDVGSLSFTYLGGEEIIIAGNMASVYRFDYNMRILDNFTYMPRQYQVQDYIPSRLLNGNAIFFFKDTNEVLEIAPDTGKHIKHKFLYEIKKVTRYRDGSFTILTKDDPEPPSITDIYRYE